MSAPSVARNWTVTIAVTVHPDGPQTLQDWLLANCEEHPEDFADQLQWFIDCQLTSTADYDGVCLDFDFDLADCRPDDEEVGS